MDKNLFTIQKKMYKFSLIIATYGRDKELDILLESLRRQIYKNFEVIILDQNEDDKISKKIEKYQRDLEIKYIKSKKKGLSYNRNKGLKNSNGDIICFPDDDCEYEVDTLKKINSFFVETSYDFYTCNTKEKNSVNTIANSLKYSTEITKKNFYRTGISFTIFYRKLNKLIYFDELLGVGAKFGAGEESDFLLELLQTGLKGYYVYDNYIYHPCKKDSFDINRSYNYGQGFGALYKKNIIIRKNYREIITFFKYILRNIGAILIAKEKKYYYYSLKGKIKGFLEYKK